MAMRSFTFSCSQEIDQVRRFRFLNFFVLDFPIMVFVEESEDLSEILRLLLEQLIEDVEFRPFDLLIVVQIIGLQKLSFELSFLETLEVLRVGSSFKVASTFLNHLQD